MWWWWLVSWLCHESHVSWELFSTTIVTIVTQKCVSWLSWYGLASICCSTQSDDMPVWITTQISYERTKNKYYFWPRSGGWDDGASLQHWVDTEIYCILAWAIRRGCSHRNVGWMGGEDREMMTSLLSILEQSFLVILKYKYRSGLWIYYQLNKLFYLRVKL